MMAAACGSGDSRMSGTYYYLFIKEVHFVAVKLIV
jgi:hypothetical protein